MQPARAQNKERIPPKSILVVLVVLTADYVQAKREQSSSEELSRLDWPVGMSLGIFFFFAC